MRFYDALQLDAAALKSQMANAGTKKEKRWYLKALLIKDVLLVTFAVVFISICSGLFGSENSSMAVVIFCILLSIRFVDFDYRMRDSLINLGLVFLILLLSPLLTQLVSPWMGFLVNLFSLLCLILMTCEKPEMGNAGLYLFGYIFLAGNMVSGQIFWKRAGLTFFGYLICGGILYFKHRLGNAGLYLFGYIFLAGNMVSGQIFWKRAGLTFFGYLICGGILYFKHRQKHYQKSFQHVIRAFRLSEKKCQWQLQLALGISLLFLLGSLCHLDRFIWVGFACSSLLSPYPNQLGERAIDRAMGAVLGSILFWLVYQITPPSLLFLFGPAAGLCLGVCGSYRYKTIFNCFGALMLASSIYGLNGAVVLRIVNNLAGIVFGYVFFQCFQKVFVKRFLMKKSVSAQEN